MPAVQVSDGSIHYKFLCYDKWKRLWLYVSANVHLKIVLISVCAVLKYKIIFLVNFYLEWFS